MDIDLQYFSGTGNSYKILDTCKNYFNQNGCSAELRSITDCSDTNKKAGLTGFCFPVYAFGIPRICKKYLSNLPQRKTPAKAFILITAGAFDESGFAVQESRQILRKKGFNVIYSAVVEMPSNWTVSLNPPSKKEALPIIDKGVEKAKKISREILDGVTFHHQFNYPAGYSKLGFYKDYYLFKWMGVSNLWRKFRTDETCDACKLCSLICPTNSIQMVDNRPRWFNSCEQCMRCVNYCPKQAIFQKGEGSVKGKNIYYEPGFKPLKLKKTEDAGIP